MLCYIWSSLTNGIKEVVIVFIPVCFCSEILAKYWTYNVFIPGSSADTTIALIIAIAVGVDALIIIIIMTAVMICCYRAKKRYDVL